MGDTPNTAGTKEVPMPWREASPMDQRTQFIADHLRDTGSITEGRRDMKDPNKGTATFCAPNIDPDFAISQHSLANLICPELRYRAAAAPTRAHTAVVSSITPGRRPSRCPRRDSEKQ